MIHCVPYRNYKLFLLAVAIGMNGCYQEPSLPNSLLPPGCRISQIDTIDSTSQHTYNYQYDRLGNRTIESVDRSIKRVFTFDTSGLYIRSQQIDNVTLAYQYDSLRTPWRINQISGGAYKYVYTYEGDNLKTYVSTEGGVTRTYSFTNGILTGLTLNPETAKVDISDGKITKTTDSQGNVINYTYVNGQVTQAEYLYAAGGRTLVTYTYDGQKHYGAGWLLARGFPGTAQSGQPGPGLDALGESIQLNNLRTVSTRFYKPNAGTEPPLSKNLTYQHQYNSDGYSLGYGRSDGVRVRYTYANCSNE
ncbi:hypothetical protein [Spirosoma spitsbergense]|uniref:hypothetical protein n=1 Tax=Spirosoma spitsbergense TaxID=431554 RepID=UPI00037AE5D5|nr:hypothetical protein [Spirosoma spitsbergense]